MLDKDFKIERLTNNQKYTNPHLHFYFVSSFVRMRIPTLFAFPFPPATHAPIPQQIIL